MEHIREIIPKFTHPITDDPCYETWKKIQVEEIYSILRYRVGVMFRYQKFLRRREKIILPRSHEKLNHLQVLVSEVLVYVVNVKFFPVNKFFFQVVWEFFLLYILTLFFFKGKSHWHGEKKETFTLRCVSLCVCMCVKHLHIRGCVCHGVCVCVSNDYIFVGVCMTDFITCKPLSLGVPVPHSTQCTWRV
jgi:hypothetical protein